MPHRTRSHCAGAFAAMMIATMPGACAAAVAESFAFEQRALDEALRPAAQRGAPATGRYAYVVSTHQVMKTRVVQFAVWLDARNCALPLAANNDPLGVAAHAVRGRLERGARAVRIDAHANAATGAPAGRVSVEVRGTDAAAVARAVRESLRRMNLVCGG